MPMSNLENQHSGNNLSNGKSRRQKTPIYNSPVNLLK